MKPQFSFLYNGERITSVSLTPRVSGSDYIYAIDDRLTVTAHLTEYPESDACHWVLSFENRGQENTAVIADILDCDALLPLDPPAPPRPGFMPKPGSLCVISMNGCVFGKQQYDSDDRASAEEFGLCHVYLDVRGQRRSCSFANVGGRSSTGTMPFFDVTASGAGYIVAVGWSGDWKADFAGRDDGVQVCTGLQNTGFYLKPGEKLRTSSVLIMSYAAGEDKYNKFRRLIRNHFSHTARPLQDELEARAREYGCHVAYDGCRVSF